MDHSRRCPGNLDPRQTTYQYDTRGNRTSVNPSGGQAQTLTYDQANRLTKFAAATTTSYGYNGDGLRMCKYAGSSTQPCSATGTTQYLWDVAGSLPLLLKDGTTGYVYGPGGLPLEQVNSSATYWFHHDQLGSTRMVTNASGGTAATYTFDPYGGLASSTNPGGITNPFAFSGQYQDSESGSYYLRARYYDASTGQFLSFDPATSTTRSPYSYTAGNPLNRIDPHGDKNETDEEGGEGFSFILEVRCIGTTIWYLVGVFDYDGNLIDANWYDTGVACWVGDPRETPEPPWPSPRPVPVVPVVPALVARPTTSPCR